MDTKRKLMACAALFIIVALMSAAGGLAANPYLPAADTYTDQNNPSMVFGANTASLISASKTFETCSTPIYVWYKFNVPSTTGTIGQAHLYITSLSGVFGSGTLDMELWSSADTSWGEATLAWQNQPALDQQLATAASVAPGSTMDFTGSTLASYLEGHKGQAVTLVVRGDCDGTVSSPTAYRTFPTKESGSSGAWLEIYGPTSIGLRNFSGTGNQAQSGWLLTVLTAVLAVDVLGLLALRKRA